MKFSGPITRGVLCVWSPGIVQNVGDSLNNARKKATTLSISQGLLCVILNELTIGRYIHIHCVFAA